MDEMHVRAPLPQRTPDGWHRFVASGDPDLSASLLSEYIVFRSPLLQSPIPGRAATLLVLIRPIEVLAALGEEMGTGSARNSAASRS